MLCPRPERGGLGRGEIHPHGVKERSLLHIPSRFGEQGGQFQGVKMNVFGDLAESLGPVIDGVHRGDHGQQDLGGADVARRLLSADVLLAGLEGETIGWLSISVARDADEASRQAALELIADGQIPRMGTTIAHRNSKALGRTNSHVGSEFTRGREQDERQRVGGHNGKASRGMNRRDGRGRVGNRSIGGWILEDSSEEARGRNCGDIPDHNTDP